MQTTYLSTCLAALLAMTADWPAVAGAEDLMDVYREAVANDPVLASADARRLVVAEGVP